MKIKLFLMISVFLLFFPKQSFAADCVPSIVDGPQFFTISSSCAFTGSVDGVDFGTGTANTAVLRIAAGTVTVSVDQTIGVGSINLTGGSLVTLSGGEVALNTALWYTDTDGDTYYSPNLVASASTPTGGTRKITVGTPTSYDCGPASANAKPNQTLYYSSAFTNVVNPGFPYDWNCDGHDERDTAQDQLYSCSASGCAAHKFTIISGWVALPACGATGTWKTYTGADAGVCGTTVAGAGTTCPTATSTTPAQKCR